MKEMILLIIFLNFGILKSQNDVAQPTIAVLPKSTPEKDAITLLSDGNSKESKASIAIGQILNERQLVVINPEQAINNFDILRAQMPGLNSDNNAMIASASGVDLYFEFSVEIVEVGPARKVVVDIKVFEVATALLLGQGGGSSDAVMPPNNDVGSLTKIAARNGMDRILESIRQYWKEVPTKGKPLTLILNFVNYEINSELPSGDYFDEVLEDWIQNNSFSYKIGMTTANTLNFSYIRVDPIKYDSPRRFGSALRKYLKDSHNISVDLQSTGKSLRIQEK